MFPRRFTSASLAFVPIHIVLGFLGSFSRARVISSYFKEIRETWESLEKPEIALQLGLLLPGMGFRSGNLILGPGEPLTCLSPSAVAPALPHFHQDPGGLSVSASLHISSCCFIPCQHPLQTALTAFTCPLASVYSYVWSLAYSFYIYFM